MHKDSTIIGRVIKESTTERFYFAISPNKIYDLEVGNIIKVKIGDKFYFAILEDIQTKSYEEDSILNYDAIDHLYSIEEEPMYIILGKAIFIDKVPTPPLPGTEVLLPDNNEISNLYNIKSEDKIEIGKIKTLTDEIKIYAKIKELIIRHTGIFGITGSGKSTTVAKIVKELLNKNIPVIIFDVHRDYIKAFDNSIIITFDNLEKKHLEEKLKQSKDSYNSKVYLAKLDVYVIKDMLEEILGISSKSAPKVFTALLKILEKFENTKDKNSETTIALETLLKMLEKNKNDESVNYISLYNRLKRLESWKLFRIKESEMGDNILTIFEKYIYPRLLDIEEKHIKEDYTEEDLMNLDDENLGFEISNIENNIKGPIIFDLYMLSLEEQKILINYVLEVLLERYKKLKFSGTPDIATIIIEEAHRFSSKDTEVAEKISTIAREGRKFGLGLILVTQIPSKIHEDIISQINTFFLLRLINPKDLEFIKKSCPYLSKEYFETLTKLTPGKCLVVGLAFKNPSVVDIIKESDIELGGSEEDIERRLKERINNIKNKN